MLFHLYKLRRSAESAIPIIMFFCEENEPRKMAKKVIDEEGLPRKLLGFRTGHLTRIPDVRKSIQSAAERKRLQQVNEPGLVLEVYSDHQDAHILQQRRQCSAESYSQCYPRPREKSLPVYLSRSLWRHIVTTNRIHGNQERSRTSRGKHNIIC